MIRLSEETLNTNKFVGLTEECQLAINGGCTSKNEPTLVETILHELGNAIGADNGEIHIPSLCYYCRKYYGYK